nr:MAG TPA: hypothetical protein [Caudoviricetes sp.]DAJ24188.1 MAG TPA: hypothetical protein [Caudoviricetes sp.]
MVYHLYILVTNYLSTYSNYTNVVDFAAQINLLVCLQLVV